MHPTSAYNAADTPRPPLPRTSWVDWQLFLSAAATPRSTSSRNDRAYLASSLVRDIQWNINEILHTYTHVHTYTHTHTHTHRHAYNVRVLPVLCFTQCTPVWAGAGAGVLLLLAACALVLLEYSRLIPSGNCAFRLYVLLCARSGPQKWKRHRLQTLST